jgi:hypothetical protein
MRRVLHFANLIYFSFIKFCFSKDPKVTAYIKNTEKRREKIKELYKQYKECKDPEEKKRLYAELDAIQVTRWRQMHRDAFK